MFLKALGNTKNSTLIFILLAGIFLMSKCGRREGFSPVNTTGMAPREVFAASHKLECVAGTGPYGYYSKALTPGGFCGLQDRVNQASGYKIEDEGSPYGGRLA